MWIQVDFRHSFALCDEDLAMVILLFHIKKKKKNLLQNFSTMSFHVLIDLVGGMVYRLHAQETWRDFLQT